MAPGDDRRRDRRRRPRGCCATCAARATAVGYELHATLIAVADEIATAAELVMGKVDGIPAAIVRGYPSAATARARPRHAAERDLFR